MRTSKKALSVLLAVLLLAVIFSVSPVIFVLASLLTQAIFGNVPWLRFFIRSFNVIGTESLLQ